ncbi:MAG: App1 family protein [Flavisolibacter sp.]
MQTADHELIPPKSLKGRFMKRLGLTNEVTIKLYHGYGHADSLTTSGHVFKLSPIPRKKYRQSFIHNTLALLRLFMVKPYPNLELQLQWDNRTLHTESDKDGFFKFEWKDEPPLRQGWHEVEVKAFQMGNIIAVSTGSVYVPYPTQYGFISDIDDTFLISHSSNLRKRLFVLFTENARSRQPFEGVVKHYQLLALSNTTEESPNPFFFVSSSEWNLYDYILEFTRVNGIPEGVFLLNQLKVFSQLLKTGQSHHMTKFTRIARILERYPNQRFVLLGDSSQQDPHIYESIVSHFPKRIHAVYIRDVHSKNQNKAADVLFKIESQGVPCCFFKHSSEAILHSGKIGLIAETTAIETID